MKNIVLGIKNHEGKAFLDGKCPNCGGEDISEITGWCYNHNNPELNGDDRPYCPDRQ